MTYPGCQSPSSNQDHRHWTPLLHSLNQCYNIKWEKITEYLWGIPSLKLSQHFSRCERDDAARNMEREIWVIRSLTKIQRLRSANTGQEYLHQILVICIFSQWSLRRMVWCQFSVYFVIIYIWQWGNAVDVFIRHSRLVNSFSPMPVKFALPCTVCVTLLQNRAAIMTRNVLEKHNWKWKCFSFICSSCSTAGLQLWETFSVISTDILAES